MSKKRKNFLTNLIKTGQNIVSTHTDTYSLFAGRFNSVLARRVSVFKQFLRKNDPKTGSVLIDLGSKQ